MTADFAGPAAAVLRAISDPGSILPRLRTHDGGMEPLPEWQTRAVLIAAAPALATAERESIRQLALTEAARMGASDFSVADAIGSGALEDFADLMTGPEHYAEAERLLEPGEHDEHEPDLVLRDIAAAQVHATLALAAATALNDATGGLDLSDYDAWRKAASVKSPKAATP